jgi:hypothetical protein
MTTPDQPTPDPQATGPTEELGTGNAPMDSPVGRCKPQL